MVLRALKARIEHGDRLSRMCVARMATKTACVSPRDSQDRYQSIVAKHRFVAQIASDAMSERNALFTKLRLQD